MQAMSQQEAGAAEEVVTAWVRDAGRPVGLTELEAALPLDPDRTVKAGAPGIAAGTLRVAPGDDERLLEVTAA